MSSGTGRAGAAGGVRTQTNLPWREAVRIALNSVRIRLGRSLITGAGILLGIAFLCFSGVTALLEAGSGDPAARNRQIWLCVMALVVCAVGITNAMLMSVSERFREIGTMKCLGALDSLIVRLFLIEALFLGLAASLAGWGVGLLGVVFARAGSLGWAAGVGPLTAGLALGSLGGCLLAGGLLTLIAALLPARRAARMPPAAALRTEV